MKIAKLFWIVGSILINVTIGIYIWLSSGAPIRLVERYEYINRNWSAYGYHWKAEFLIMALLTIAASYFAVAFKKVGWVIVTVGLAITLATYPIMLGGYRNTSLEVFVAAVQIATVVFVFGNALFFAGLCWIYYQDDLLSNWLRVLSVSLSLIVCLSFSGTSIGLWEWKQALVVAPLVNLLYFINAYYGMKLKHPVSSGI